MLSRMTAAHYACLELLGCHQPRCMMVEEIAALLALDVFHAQVILDNLTMYKLTLFTFPTGKAARSRSRHQPKLYSPAAVVLSSGSPPPLPMLTKGALLRRLLDCNDVIAAVMDLKSVLQEKWNMAQYSNFIVDLVKDGALDSVNVNVHGKVLRCVQLVLTLAELGQQPEVNWHKTIISQVCKLLNRLPFPRRLAVDVRRYSC